MDTFIPVEALRGMHRGSYLLVDVRRAEAFAADPEMLAGATWRDPFAVTEWQKYLPRHLPVVFYCVHGHEISRNACAAAADAGVVARYLQGGMDSARLASMPLIRKDPDCRVPSAPGAPSRWITRARPRIDRLACPWLVRRFIDPLAEFLYVEARRVLDEAKRQGAIPYDIPGVRFSHRSERCSFDALVEDFALNDPALAQLATIVRGADTDRLDLAPQCAGLLAVSLGLAEVHADDLDLLAAAMPVYDALYTWCEQAEAGRDERHSWKPAT
jgi:rhodanese-related sulfurtransferase